MSWGTGCAGFRQRVNGFLLLTFQGHFKVPSKTPSRFPLLWLVSVCMDSEHTLKTSLR